MDYEEKYKSALGWMQSLYGGLHGATKEEAEKYFPELKESEGERIRKKLISFVENWKNFRPNSPFDDYAVYTSDRDECDRILAWLEKQGEQKTDDKVEPKSHPGEWLRENEPNNFDIQDARDGDLIYVSTEEKGIQAIFHEYKNDTIFFHCYLCTDFVQGGCMPIGSVELTYPLQKTHYNRFFEKMHEAGYEWDGEKKEVKKIDVKTLDADKVIGWLNHRELSCDDVVTTVIPDDSPTSVLHKVKLLSDEFIKQFKKDFGL